MVEASWTDQSGTLHKCSATMENTSKSGARIRLRKPIQVGTKLRVQWRWEQFTGAARYCRGDGRDFVVGIQKDPESNASVSAGKSKVAASAAGESHVELAAAVAARQLAEPQNDTIVRQTPPEPRPPATPAAAQPVNANRARETILSVASLTPPPTAGLERPWQPGTMQWGPSQGMGKTVEEKKPMRRRWFGLGHKDENPDSSSEAVRDFSNEETPAGATRGVDANADLEQPDEPDGVELLSMADIYQTAGIRGPRKGYSINKVVEMLRSEHLRGLSKEMKRASILVALDAAGISIDEVVDDAKARLEAIDSYEASQRKQFEAHLVRRAEENQQIMAELERIKATYADRLRRNLDGVAREKATFGNWLTLKQQETANIGEALELCTKAAATEPAKTEIDPTLISSKPV
ncbi:MAG TPA: hypothetical protein VMH31_09860 [Methylomirabilota bacterium]|nr:hypothetical protein [Methylomirabilota bacterium]